MVSRVWVLAAILATAASPYIAKAQAFGGDELVRVPSSADQSINPGAMSSGSISGAIRTDDNHPIDEAKIEVHDLVTGSSIAYGYTDHSGSFRLSNVPPGSYEVVATSGLSQQREQVTTRGTPVEITMVLPHTAKETNPATGNASTVSVKALQVPEKAQNALKKAREAAAKNKFDVANREVDKALEIEPRFSDAIAFRGVLKMHSGDLSAAANDLQQAIQIDSNNAVAYVAMGSLFNLQKQYDSAARELDRSIALDPNAWQAHYEMSKAQLGKGKYSDGLRELDKAQSLLGHDHDFSPMHVVKGQLLLGVKAFGAAASEFQKFLTKDGSSPVAAQVKQDMDRAKAFAETNR